MKRYLVVSALLFVAALAGGLVLLAGISGPHMGAAIFAGYLVIVLAVLGLNLLVALAWVLPARARLALVAVAAFATAAVVAQKVFEAARKKREQAKQEAAALVESQWQEKVLALPREALLRWLKDGTFDARRPKQISPSVGLLDRAEAMAQTCQLDAELLDAIARRMPLSIINLLDDTSDCPSHQRQEWFAHFRSELFSANDATSRWELARDLLRLDVSGDYLRQFVASGYRLDSPAPDHPPLLFDVLASDDALLARTRALLALGARRDLEYQDLTPRAFFEKRAKERFSDGEMPEEWRETLALLRN